MHLVFLALGLKLLRQQDSDMNKCNLLKFQTNGKKKLIWLI